MQVGVYYLSADEGGFGQLEHGVHVLFLEFHVHRPEDELVSVFLGQVVDPQRIDVSGNVTTNL